jgi:hypothetical protein
MPRGNPSNLVDPARRKKMNDFYKKDLPKFMAFLKKDSLTRYEKSFIMTRAWASVNDKHETDYPFTSLNTYISKNKAALDKKAAASEAKKVAKREKKEEKKQEEKEKKAKKRAKAVKA